ncbi:MAG: nucleoside triphosphate pyrophosphatase [Sedimentisphaerales bacterium]
MPEEKFHFILASASPRRKELLEKAGYKFDIVISNIDESKNKEKTPIKFACAAALAKANDIAKKFPDKIIIGADTIADFDGEIIGKAKNAKDAEQITRKLFSKPHKIITGIAIVKKNAGLEIVDYDTTIVYPVKMSEKEIEKHIASGIWQGKAGAYAIQQGGDKFIEHIKGSESNVMGLSMELLEKMIKKVQKCGHT